MKALLKILVIPFLVLILGFTNEFVVDNDSGNTYYYDQNSEMVTNKIIEIDSKYYYFNEQGIMQKGLVVYNNESYYFNDQGQAYNGLSLINGKYYYLEVNGRLKYNWQTIDNNRYYFDKNGQALTGLQAINGINYLFDSNGKMKTGLQTYEEKKYYFNDQGQGYQGLQLLSGNYYYLTNGLVNVSQFVTVNNERYYFNDQGVALNNFALINAKPYYFDQFKAINGLKTIGTKTYYAKDYILQNGWQTINNQKYYFNNYLALKGKSLIASKYYYFDKTTGINKIGWILDGQYNYYNPYYIKKTGFQTINNRVHYFNDQGYMYRSTTRGLYTFNSIGQSYRNPAIKTIRMNIPLYNQKTEKYYSGCEFFSLRMALAYKGKTLSAKTLYDQLPRSGYQAKRKADGKYYWVDPQVMFTGDPKGVLGVYKDWGVYPRPIKALGDKYRPTRDISKLGYNELEKELALRHPVIIWATANYYMPHNYFAWTKPDGKTFYGYSNYHVTLATGFDEKYVYINDPLGKKYRVEKEQFKRVFTKSGGYALAIQ